LNTGRQRECRVVAYGDSLTEGLGAAREESYPAILSRLMGFELCNFGVSGRTTSVALDAMSEVLDAQPKAVVLLLGANDALRGLSSLQTKENILQMVNKLKAQGVMVVLAGIDSHRSDIPKFLKDLHTLYVEIANELSDDVLFIPSAMDGILGDPALTSSDGMHPNSRGYARLAQNLFDAAFSQALDMLRAIPAMSPNHTR
jgi:lysophospholipase L1-like esterase